MLWIFYYTNFNHLNGTLPDVALINIHLFIFITKLLYVMSAYGVENIFSADALQYIGPSRLITLYFLHRALYCTFHIISV